MLALLLAVLDKIGATPAIIALTLYALLPIVRNTLAGLESVSPEVLEAAKGIGMTPRQQLGLVELPLALPIIVAGIRTAAVVGVGIATLSAFIGAGGLGQFINRGLALANTDLILLGAIPAALLALLVDFSLGGAAWGLQPVRQKHKGTWKARLRPVALCLPLLLVGLGLATSFGGLLAMNPIVTACLIPVGVALVGVTRIMSVMSVGMAPVGAAVFVALAIGISECENLERRVRRGPLNRTPDFPYHPHVTVAHHLSDDLLDRAFKELSEYEAEFPVWGFSLYEHGLDGVWRPQRDFAFGAGLPG